MKKLSLLIIFLIITGCSKNSTSSESDIEISWQGGWSFTYRYASGTLVGGNWYKHFEVIDGSGDIIFKGYVNNSKKITESFTVEEGLTYKIKVSVSFGDCSASSSSTAEIRSSSANNNVSFQVDCNTLTISSISISEVTD